MQLHFVLTSLLYLTNISHGLRKINIFNSLKLVGNRNKLHIGTLYEYKDAPCIIQDVSFNVADATEDSELFLALFQNSCKVIRQTIQNQEVINTLGFGPDSYETSPSFYPGVSSFYENGGHATISLHSKQVSDGINEIYDSGNGLKFIKIGAENIRISKALAKGALLKTAYGWVDLSTKGGVPLEVVVGVSRDPIMLVSIQVSNLEESKKFFKEQLGMMELPFPLSRQNGSAFEPQQPKNSVFLGYAEDSFGLLLNQFSSIPVDESESTGSFLDFFKSKKPVDKTPQKLSIGSQLRAITIVYNDEIDDRSKLPTIIQSEFSSDREMVIKSPDGYPFILKPYSQHKKYAIKEFQIE